MRSIASRLTRIEACLPRRPVRRPLSDADTQYWDTFESLLRKMDPDHANLLKSELRRWACARYRGSHFKISSLLWSAFRIVKGYLATRTPLVMPAEMATIYISNPDLDSLVRVRGLRIRASSPTSTAARARADHLLCPMASV